MKILRTTFGVVKRLAYAESSHFIGDLRDYFAVTATLAGSPPESQYGSLGHGTTREITNSPS